MISNRELKDEIEQLNEQHQYLTEELRSIKEILTKQSANNDKQSGTYDSASGKGNQNANGNSNNQNNELSAIATDFSKLKDLTSQLEAKMQSYISNNPSGGSTITNEDTINLILAIMNGMIDWTMDIVSKPNNNQ